MHRIARSRIVANFNAKGWITKLTAYYSMNEAGLGISHVYELFRGAALELAGQIKTLIRSTESK